MRTKKRQMKMKINFTEFFFPEYFSNDWKFDLTKSYFSMAIDAKG